MNIAPCKKVASGFLSLILLVPQGLLAQTVSTDQLMETIKKLEARIAELESKAGGSVASAKPATTSAPAPAQPSVAELKKDVDDIKKQQEEAAPTLSFFKSTQ